MMLENILADFELLDDWEDRYRYVIELGRSGRRTDWTSAA
jgi:sulfur transfer protein SufE